MKAPVVLETLCEQLREAQLHAWVTRVTQLYQLTYREAYAAGQSDCEERWADQQEDIDEQRNF